MNIDAKTIAAGGVAAGLLLGAWGLVASDSPDAPRSDVGRITATAPQTGPGMLTTAERVSFWQARADARPDGFLDRTQLGVALLRQAREEADLELYAAAEAALRDALDVYPDHVEARLALGQALHGQHRFAEARDLAFEVWLQESTSPQALALLGDTNLELGHHAAAAEHFDRLTALERSAPVVARLSQLAYATGRPDEAVALAEEALSLSADLPLSDHDRAFYWFQLGHVRFATGAVDGAIDALETALQIAPGHGGATERLAGIYAAVGRDADAEQLYAELLEGGAAADLHGSYADLLRDRGAVAEADRHERLGMDLALATLDDFPAERRHLVGFLQTRDPELAVELALADLAERQDPGAYDTAAWALHHAGRSAEARPLIDEALASGIRDAAIEAHAGFIAAAVGDDDAARRHLQRSLDINDRFDRTDAPAARSLLSDLTAELGSG